MADPTTKPDSHAAKMRTNRTPKRFKRLKRLVLACLILLLLTVIFLPKIVSPIARPIAQNAINDRIKGRATLGTLGLSWLGDQRIKLALEDPEGKPCATMDIRSDKSLLSLAMGSKNLGITHLTGTATITRDPSGTTNLARALEPRMTSASGSAPSPSGSTPAGKKPMQLPRSLAGSLVIDSLSITLEDPALANTTDNAIGAVRVGNLSGAVDFAIGKPVTVSLAGPVLTAPDLDHLSASTADAGKLAVELTIDHLTDASGTLTPDAIDAKGTLAMQIPAVDLHADIGYANKTITRTGPTQVSLDIARLADVLPSVARALAAQPGVTINHLPTATVTLNALSLPLGSDLRHAQGQLTIATTQVAGTMSRAEASSNNNHEAVKPVEFRIEPLSLVLDIPSLAQGITLRGSTRASIDTQSAGTVSVDLKASDLLDEQGKLVAGMPGSIAGQVLVKGFATPIVQPFIAAAVSTLPESIDVNLPRDLGPSLDLTLNATAHNDSPAASEAGYDIDLVLKAANASVNAGVLVDGQQILSKKQGLHASFASLSPLLDSLLEQHGMHITKGAQVAVTMRDFAIDLGSLQQDDHLDLRSVKGHVSLDVGQTTGTYRPSQSAEPESFTLQSMAINADTEDLAEGLVLNASASTRADNKPLADLAMNMVVRNLLDAKGSPVQGVLPQFNGQIKLTNVATDTLDALLGERLADTGLVLARDVGSPAALTVLVEPAPKTDNTTNAPAEHLPADAMLPMLAEPMQLGITFRAKHLDITAPLVLKPDRLIAREPILLVDRNAGATIAAFLNRANAPTEPTTTNNPKTNAAPSALSYSVAPGGSVRLAVDSLDVPLRSSTPIAWDSLTATSTLTIDGMRAIVDPDGSHGEQPPQQVAIQSWTTTIAMTPGSDPTIVSNGRFAHADQTFTLALNATLQGLINQATASAAASPAIDLSTIRPKATLTLDNIPATLARLVPQSAVRVGDTPLNTALLWRDTLGKHTKVVFTTNPVRNKPTTTAYKLLLTSQGLHLSTLGTISPELFFLNRIDAKLGITPRVASYLSPVLASDAPLTPALVTPASVELHTNKHVSVPLGRGYAPDLANATGDLDATLSLNAELAAMSLKPGSTGQAGPAPASDAPNAKALTIPPMTIKDLTLALQAPAAIFGQQGASADISIDGQFFDEHNKPLMTLQGSGSATIADGTPTGTIPVSLSLAGVATPWLDRLLAQPALVSGMVGPTLDLAITADLDRLAKRSPGKPGPLTVSLSSPRLTTTAPIRVAFSKQGLYLQDALTADWTIQPAWANRYLFASGKADASNASKRNASLTMLEPTPTQLHIQRFGMSLKPLAKPGAKPTLTMPAGPFKPGIFVLDSFISLPHFKAKMSDGIVVALDQVKLGLWQSPKVDTLGFALTVPRITVGDHEPITPKNDTIKGTIASYRDARGNLTPDAARLSAKGGIGPIPTDIIDALAQQNGLLRDALGPTLSLTLDAENFSRTSGSLKAAATTPLASFDVSGTVRDGLFLIDTTSGVTIRAISPGLSARFQKAVPVIATLEKTTKDKPAKVVFDSPLALPIDGNLDRLNGHLTIDIGTARFSTTDIFSEVLKIAQQKAAGEIGHRLPPMTVNIDNGLVTYKPYPLPFGEFTITSVGAINLSSKTRDISLLDMNEQLDAKHLKVLTLIPAGAFAAEAIPGLAKVPVPVIGNLARLPIVTHGPVNQPKSEIDVDLMGKDAINQLTDPKHLLDGPAGGLLDDLFNKKKNEK